MEIRKFLLIVFASICFTNLHANELVDSLQEKMAAYNREKPVINLYVHLDRNTYQPEDTLWFKAYVLTPILNDVLYIRLADHNKNIVLEKQFPMYDIRAHGDLVLPDTLPEGSYFFYAYTDRIISLNPNDVFVQPITVSNVITHKLEAEASVTNLRKVHRGDKVEILTRVKGAAGKTLKGRFELWVGDFMIKKGALSTNNLGEAYLRFTYPAIENNEMLRCEIRFTQDKEVAELSLNLRHEGNKANVKVCPEGGHLLDGLTNNTVFQVFDDNKNTMSVPIELLGNHQRIAQTKTDNQGLGLIRFTPHADIHYQIKVFENDTTTLLEFPDSVETYGMGLHLETDKKGITAVLNNRSSKDSATLVLRSMDRILWNGTYKVGRGDSLKVELPVQAIPKSILGLAVFDSLSAPKAERMFLNKPTNPYRVRIQTTRKLQKRVNSLNVQVTVVDAENQPVATNVSVSIVEKSTLDRSKYRTIMQSHYFQNLTGAGTKLYDENEPGFDEWLQTMSWGTKNWNRLLAYEPTGYIRLLDNTGGISGKVHYRGKGPVKLGRMTLESTISADKKDLVPMMKLFGGAQQPGSYRLGKISYTIKDWLESVPVDSNGNFNISSKSLLVQPNETKILKPGVFFSNDYDLELVDFSKEMDAFVLAGKALESKRPVSSFTKYVAPTVKLMSKVVELKEVAVESRSGLYLSETNIGRKEDYVCREFNVFNCRNHRTGGLKPVIGTVYVRSERGNLFLYNGVGKPFTPAPDGALAGSLQYVPIKNISRPNTFYNPGTTDSLFLKAETRSTVYWSPNLYTDPTGKTSFQCNLSDRTGEFIIVVQGLEVKTRTPIFGTYEFNL
jgi:hypothetical protein